MTDLSKIRIMNSAGCIKDVAGAIKACMSPIPTEICVGSFTPLEKLGNSGQTLWVHPDGLYSFNSIGLKNRGFAYLTNGGLNRMISVAQGVKKKLRLSIAGETASDYVDGAKIAVNGGVDTLELNLGCPNVVSGGKQKTIAAYSLELIADITSQVATEREKSSLAIAVKLSPYATERMLAQMLFQYPEIQIDPQRTVSPAFIMQVGDVLSSLLSDGDEVVLSNTFPNATTFENGKSVINARSADGSVITTGGLSGDPLFEIVYENITELRPYLRPDISITWCGGIKDGKTLKRALEADADAVQFGLSYIKDENPKIFSDAIEEYATLIA